MNFELNYDGFEDYMVYSHNRAIGEGKHYVFRFENGYGASVVKYNDEPDNEYSCFTSSGYWCDEWELAVVRFEEKPIGLAHPIPGGEYVLVYNTFITDDVTGGTDEEIKDLLRQIKALPKK